MGTPIIVDAGAIAPGHPLGSTGVRSIAVGAGRGLAGAATLEQR